MSVRSNSFLACLLVGSGMLGGALSSWLLNAEWPADAAEGRQAADVITAREFRLVDKAGITRAVLTTSPDGTAGLSLLDEQQRARAVFALWRDGKAYLTLKDRAGNSRAWVRLDQSGKAGVAVLDVKGKQRTELEAGLTEPTGLAIYLDDHREVSLGVFTPSGGSEKAMPALTIGSSEKAVIGHGGFLQGRAFGVFLFGSEDRESLSLTRGSRGEANLLMRDVSGRTRVSLACGENGAAALRFLDKESKPTVELQTHESGRYWDAGLRLSFDKVASVGMWTMENGWARLWCNAGEQGTEARVEATPTGKAQLILKNDKYKSWAGLSVDEHPCIGLYENTDKAVFKAP
jgi:hypothetical protein